MLKYKYIPIKNATKIISGEDPNKLRDGVGKIPKLTSGVVNLFGN